MMTAMQKDFKEDVPSPDEPENNFHKQVSPASTRTRGAFTSWINGLADKFGLDPKTIFAANFALLQDDPHNLFAGQELQILPTDGVYWEWLGGISFGAWADYFQVKPEDIINYPANHLDARTVGDPANANIPVGTWLVIPGGEYEYHTPGAMPLGITRTDPASAQVAGSGSCPPFTGGAIGS